MVHHETWYSHLCKCILEWVSHNRIILYIAFVLTLSLAVQVFNFSLVGK